MVHACRKVYERKLGELRDKFCLKFFPESWLVALRKDIICFQQNEKKSIGAAWARFLLLVKSGPVLSLPDYVFAWTLLLGARHGLCSYLDMTAGGSFAHKTLSEGMEILEIISGNTSFVAESTPSQEQRKSSHEDILAAKPDCSLYIPLDLAQNPLLNHEFWRKKKFELQNSISNSRMILLKILKTPRIMSARGDH